MLFALNSPSRLYILCPGCHLFDLTLQSNSNVHTHWNTVWVCLCWADRFAGMEDQTRRHSHEAGKALGFRRQKSPEAGWEPETSKVSTPLNRNSQSNVQSLSEIQKMLAPVKLLFLQIFSNGKPAFPEQSCSLVIASRSLWTDAATIYVMCICLRAISY